jgi:hypothetical protein
MEGDGPSQEVGQQSGEPVHPGQGACPSRSRGPRHDPEPSREKPLTVEQERSRGGDPASPPSSQHLSRCAGRRDWRGAQRAGMSTSYQRTNQYTLSPHYVAAMHGYVRTNLGQDHNNTAHVGTVRPHHWPVSRPNTVWTFDGQAWYRYRLEEAPSRLCCRFPHLNKSQNG